MLPLRHVTGWRIAGVMLLLFVFGAMIAPVWLWPGAAVQSFVEFDKWIHGAAFVVLAVWFSGQYARGAYWRIALGLAVFGGMTELVQQQLIYRSADGADMLANLAGIGVGLLIALAGAGGWSLRVESWLRARGTGR